MTLDQLLLVRHDLSSLNRRGRIQGQSNTPLQAGFRGRVDDLTDRIVGQRDILPQRVPIHVISSDLDRTYGTAERVHRRLWDKHHYPTTFLYTILLRERGQGELEGKSFEEALPLLSNDPNLSPNAETIYGLLYSSNNIPKGETHNAVGERLNNFVGEYIQELKGTGIVVTHLISGMNYLKNLLTDGNILGSPPRPYQNYPNLSVVRLELDPLNYMRYRETGQYGPLINKGITATVVLDTTY